VDIQKETIPKIHENVKARKEQFGLLLVSKRTPILALNDDSRVIWECFDGVSTVEEIASRLKEETEEDLEQTIETVKCFVESCYDLGLIEI